MKKVKHQNSRKNFPKTFSKKEYTKPNFPDFMNQMFKALGENSTPKGKQGIDLISFVSTQKPVKSKKQ